MALSLTEHEVKADDLHACHRLRGKQKRNVIVLFKNRKQRHKVLVDRKKLAGKSTELQALKFEENLFINESMAYENRVLAYKCRQMKKHRKIHATWFFMNAVNVQLEKDGAFKQIFHIKDLEELISMDDIDGFIIKENK